jgi:hypothetical protein
MATRSLGLALSGVLVTCAIGLSPLPVQAQVPTRWVFAGELQEAGAPVQRIVDIDIELFESATEGEAVYLERHRGISVEGGLFNLEIGAEVPVLPSLLSGNPLWLSVTVDGDALSPRLPIGSVPYAHRASLADSSANNDGIAVGGTAVIDEEGNWVGAPIGPDGIDLGGFTPSETEDLVDALRSYVEAAETANTMLVEQIVALEDALELAQERLDGAELFVGPLSILTEGVSREGDDLIFDGMNVYIQSGFGQTFHSADLDTPGSPNGHGNLVIGYDEQDGRGDERPGGSHNLVIGPGHRYLGLGGILLGRANTTTGVGGLAHGTRNELSGDYAAAIGGSDNTVAGVGAAAIGGSAADAVESGCVVVGGERGSCQGVDSAVVGGQLAQATGVRAVTVAGAGTVASGEGSVAIGGETNTASGAHSVTVGGRDNAALGALATAIGGLGNDAIGERAVTVGGSSNRAEGDWSAALGGGGGFDDPNVVEGEYAVILGGGNSRATGTNSLVVGGDRGLASGLASAVFGGMDNVASGDRAVVVGGSRNLASGGLATAVGGTDNESGGSATTIVGGSANRTCLALTTVVGGTARSAETFASVCVPASSCPDSGVFCP